MQQANVDAGNAFEASQLHDGKQYSLTQNERQQHYHHVVLMLLSPEDSNLLPHCLSIGSQLRSNFIPVQQNIKVVIVVYALPEVFVLLSLLILLSN